MEETLGKRIVARRKQMGLTQDKLAELLGVTAQAVSKWENDQSCPDITMLPRLAEVFGCTTDELLGLAPKQVHTAEVVARQDKNDDEPEGLHIENGNWEFSWDGGRRGSLGFAVWVLLSGLLLFLTTEARIACSFWDILWTSGLTLFGLFGIVYPRFSVFRLGCAFLGGYFMCQRVFFLSMNTNYILVVFLLCFGVVLLISALRKPKSGSFRVRHNGQSPSKGHCSYEDETFSCSTSFGSNSRCITLPRLSGGEASLSFGELTVDLSGCKEIADGCTLDLSCSFGELALLIPRTCRAEPNIGTAFSAFEIEGSPDPNADTVIYVNGSVNFGHITLRYF